MAKKVVALGCVSWRQTGGCTPAGPREPAHDQRCGEDVSGPTSGYCECEGGATTSHVTCQHAPFTCLERCATMHERAMGAPG
jgi:alpha 1,2-mannosyltransferase